MASLSDMDRLGISLMGTPAGANSLVPTVEVSPNLKSLVDELYRHLGMKSPDILCIDNEKEFVNLVHGVGRNMQNIINWHILGVASCLITMVVSSCLGMTGRFHSLDDAVFAVISAFACLFMCGLGYDLRTEAKIHRSIYKHFKHSGPIDGLASGHRVRRKLKTILENSDCFDRTALSDKRESTSGLSLMWRHSSVSWGDENNDRLPFEMIGAFNKASRWCSGVRSPILGAAVALNKAVDAALLGDGCVVLLVSKYAI
jgi:hypothetical protein